MAKIFVVFVTIFILQTSVQAADKIRISIAGLGGVFMTFPLAYKNGFLKEEGVEAEIIRISSAGGANLCVDSCEPSRFDGRPGQYEGL